MKIKNFYLLLKLIRISSYLTKEDDFCFGNNINRNVTNPPPNIAYIPVHFRWYLMYTMSRIILQNMGNTFPNNEIDPTFILFVMLTLIMCYLQDDDEDLINELEETES